MRERAILSFEDSEVSSWSSGSRIRDGARDDMESTSSVWMGGAGSTTGGGAEAGGEEETRVIVKSVAEERDLVGVVVVVEGDEGREGCS